MRKTLFKSLAGTLTTILLVSCLIVPPLPAKGDIISLIIAVVAIAGGGVAYDYASCDVNLIWGCNDGGGAGGASRGDRRGSAADDDEGGDGSGGFDTRGTRGNGSGSGTGSGGQFCTSAANSCGMTSTGTTNAQGVCSALPPPVSSCPAPLVGTFEAQPTLVRRDNTTTLSWEVSQATACSLSGGGLNLTSLSLTGSRQSNPIVSRTEFTLTCFNGDPAQGAPSTSDTAVVNLIPEYEEI